MKAAKHVLVGAVAMAHPAFNASNVFGCVMLLFQDVFRTQINCDWTIYDVGILNEKTKRIETGKAVISLRRQRLC
jgi:hypothetical protein